MIWGCGISARSRRITTDLEHRDVHRNAARRLAAPDSPVKLTGRDVCWEDMEQTDDSNSQVGDCAVWFIPCILFVPGTWELCKRMPV